MKRLMAAIAAAALVAAPLGASNEGDPHADYMVKNEVIEITGSHMIVIEFIEELSDNESDPHTDYIIIIEVTVAVTPEIINES